MALFDFPSASVSNEQRVVTNVPLQKLFFLNGGFTLDQSKAFAARLASELSEDKRISLAYNLAYGRPPSEKESGLAKKFLDATGSDGWAQLAQVLFSANEFAFVD